MYEQTGCCCGCPGVGGARGEEGAQQGHAGLAGRTQFLHPALTAKWGNEMYCVLGSESSGVN